MTLEYGEMVTGRAASLARLAKEFQPNATGGRPHLRLGPACYDIGDWVFGIWCWGVG